MDCFGTCFTHVQTSDVKPPCKRPRSPLQLWRQPLSSSLRAPSKPPSPSEGFKPPWSPLQALLKPSEGEAPLKPPSSLLEAPFKPPSSSPPWSLPKVKPPWSCLEASLKPPSSPLQAPLKPPWSVPKVKPPSTFRPSSPPPLAPRPFEPPWRGLLKGVPRNQPRSSWVSLSNRILESAPGILRMSHAIASARYSVKIQVRCVAVCGTLPFFVWISVELCMSRWFLNFGWSGHVFEVWFPLEVFQEDLTCLKTWFKSCIAPHPQKSWQSVRCKQRDQCYRVDSSATCSHTVLEFHTFLLFLLPLYLLFNLFLSSLFSLPLLLSPVYIASQGVCRKWLCPMAAPFVPLSQSGRLPCRALLALAPPIFRYLRAPFLCAVYGYPPLHFTEEVGKLSGIWGGCSFTFHWISPLLPMWSHGLRVYLALDFSQQYFVRNNQRRLTMSPSYTAEQPLWVVHRPCLWRWTESRRARNETRSTLDCHLPLIDHVGLFSVFCFFGGVVCLFWLFGCFPNLTFL